MQVGDGPMPRLVEVEARKDAHHSDLGKRRLGQPGHSRLHPSPSPPRPLSTPRHRDNEIMQG